MDTNLDNFIMANSPDGGFLQSVYWREFQESVGRKTCFLEEKDENGDILIYANAVAHNLPVVGDYFYIPRGPVGRNPKSLPADATHQALQAGEILNPKQYQIPNTKYQNFLDRLLKLVKENDIGWIRIEPNSEEELNLIKENLPNEVKMKKAPVDVQPREILVLDITKSEEEILAEMKQKTRYNIKLSQKRGVSVKEISNLKSQISNQYIKEFLKLVKITAERDKITAHPEKYYRQMFEIIPPEILKLYVAEYEGKIIAANLVLFFGKTATYMHGASDNTHRDVMAPYLLQWQAILDAKKAGCTKYDLGGVKTTNNDQRSIASKSWEGITRFKTGFAPNAEPSEFPGCYDIVLKSLEILAIYYIKKKIKP